MTLQKELLEEHLDQWKAAGLIDDRQWTEITRYERQHGPGLELPGRRIPVIAEAIGYLGAALAAAAVMFFAINQWKEWSDTTRATVLAVATLAAFAAAWMTRTSEEPAIRRFSTVLMTLTVGGTAATTLILCNDVYDVRDSYSAQIAGGAALVVALGLYLLRRHMLLQLAMLGAMLLTILPAYDRIGYPEASIWNGATLLGVGVAWFALGWLKVLEPARGARIVGPIVALMGPTSMYDGSPDRTWMLVLGVILAITIVTASIFFTQPELTFIGAIFTFQYLLIWLQETFKGTLAVPVALLVAGGIALGAALVLTRRMRGRPGTGS
jgi:uncharacterized membrane protein